MSGQLIAHKLVHNIDVRLARSERAMGDAMRAWRLVAGNDPHKHFGVILSAYAARWRWAS